MNIIYKGKQMKNDNIDIFTTNHKELVDNWYNKWTNDIKRKLPSCFAVTDAEIDSEITSQCIYLAKLFKGGSYVAYCNEFVTKRALNTFFDEYRKLNHAAIVESIQEYEDDYRDSYTIAHQYGDYDVDDKVTIDEEIENSDIVESVKSMAKDNIDKQIIVMILDGSTYDEIAAKLNITKGTITNRMKAIGAKLKADENF